MAYTTAKSITLEDRFKSDFFVLFGIAFIGLLGCVYLLILCNQPSNNIPSFSDYNSSTTIDSKKNHFLANGIDYSGVCMIGKPLNFNIPSLPAEGKLLIDYGNGDNQMVANQTMSYSYDRLGVYNVRLLQIKEDGLHTLANEYVEISPTF